MGSPEIASTTSRIVQTSDSSDDLIGKTRVLQVVPFSDTTLWRQVRAGNFPAPVKISPGRVAWRVRDVQQWIRTRGVCS